MCLITSVTVENWRGFTRASLSEFTALTVLAGSNGCGKSSVLEAILIAGGRSPGDAIGRAVLRRADAWNASRWLFHDHDDADVTAALSVERTRGTRAVKLTWNEGAHALHMPWTYAEPASWIRAEGLGPDEFVSETAFSADNQYRFQNRGGPSAGEMIRLVDPVNRTRDALHRVVSRAIDGNRIERVETMLERLTHGELSGVRIATEDPAVPVVRVRQGNRNVPVAVAGDGVASLIRVACELAAPAGSVVLLEEPEVHLHAKALWELSEAISETVGTGVQVIMTTHSDQLLEFLDQHTETRPQMTLVGMSRLADGTLNSFQGRGEDVADVRERAFRVMHTE